MKNTDKVTLTVGQLKKLVKESKKINENASGFIQTKEQFAYELFRALDYGFIEKLAASQEEGTLKFNYDSASAYKPFAEMLVREVQRYIRRLNY